ncbi:rod shape-determining protein MreC [Alkaliphilus metalliredigens QYMF]|uniref:Cell shape-determining protein MreC n=1 Tax=Alkaliphilus metalliredigens (strain QYMF) TaxID=293826 RepID=A6TQI0_ALKMQ|nr:rod shape-determining protein MreC [Alkaliphilus metalliredigens]ABR48448.1 rod shape-determining protein MreC [Alkaliphilus metalliredigens QYMF]
MAKKTSKDRVAMIVAVVAIILIIVMSMTSNQREEMTVVERWIGNIVTPLQRTVSASTNVVAENARAIVQFSSIKASNEQLKEDIAIIQREMIDLRLERNELEELRELKHALNYIEEQENYQPIAANIIGKNPGNWFNTFTINVGRKHNVSKNDIVLEANGLVGRVYEAGDYWAKVVSIVDHNSSVSFQLLRDNTQQGILSGSITSELTGYLFDPLAEVVVGDKLVTSVLGVYPQGIVIGEVVEVAKSSDQLLKTVVVEPEVNFTRMSKVIVMKSLEQEGN